MGRPARCLLASVLILVGSLTALPTPAYSYEPWHYRYVGHATAAAVHASGMTLREAIWAAHGP